MQDDEERQRLEEYFRDLDVGDGVLRPGMSSIVCFNIRYIFRALGYDIEHDSDEYDEDLARIVLRFQKDNNHQSQDGLFGPGTRRLLVQKLMEGGVRTWQVIGRLQLPREFYINQKTRKILEEIAHYRKLIEVCEKRKRVLELKASTYGIDAPPHVVTELDDVKEEMLKYHQRITDLEKKIAEID